MSAGQPNWQRLHELGKLPKSARNKVPLLGELDSYEALVAKIQKECCDDCKAKFFSEQKPAGSVEVKCEVDGCDHVASGKSEAVAKNNLRLHNRSHEPKE